MFSVLLKRKTRIAALLSFCLPLSVLLADDTALPPLHSPKVCDGLQSEGDTFVRSDMSSGDCKKDAAVLSAIWSAVSRWASGGEVPLRGNCCQLPAPDILTESRAVVSESCPDGYVVTGKRDPKCRSCFHKMVCTQINHKRYKLAPETSGAFVGHSTTVWLEKFDLLVSDLPPAFRYSVARSGLRHWDRGECVGYPIGSLLTSKSGKRCYQYGFRQLLYRGINGDPPAGTPVKLFPDCVVVTNILDGPAQCQR